MTRFCDHLETDLQLEPPLDVCSSCIGDRRHLGALAPVPDVRADELLQPEPQPARHGPLPRDGPSDDPVRRTGRGLAMVLPGRPPLSTRPGRLRIRGGMTRRVIDRT